MNMQSTLRLFSALPVENKKRKQDKELTKKTIPLGFVFSPSVVANYTNHKELIKTVSNIFGLSGKQLNSSFHKSWKKVKETDIEQLVVEQIAHYLTTYGKKQPEEYIEEKSEQFGVENLGEKIVNLEDFESDKVGDNYIYIPKEKLEIPQLEEVINLRLIKGYTKKELKEKLLKMLNSGIALSEQTITDISEVAIFVELNESEIKKIKNKEVKIMLYEYLNLVPEDPVEFLRMIIYKATGKTLLIKSRELIEEIKEKERLSYIRDFARYDTKFGYAKLASVFYRFKPVFLAFRNNKSTKKIINKIRKLATTNHKPLEIDYLNSVTSIIKKGEKIDSKKLSEELEKVNVFRKIRLAYALKFRTKNIESILYRIRNGKGYAKEASPINISKVKPVLDTVIGSIIEDLKKNVKGKKIYIPESVKYALPATEKQFTGYFPSGSYICSPKDMIAGVYWENTKNKRVDLDLSSINAEGSKIGWDASYRNDRGNILFSGDVTDAPKGATEFIYLQRQAKTSNIVFVNYYNYDSEVPVPYKIIIAKEQASNMKENYAVDPNNVLAVANSEADKKQKLLGLFVTTTAESRFYFVETNIGRDISSYGNEFVEHARKYLVDFYTNTINLNELLEKAGAKFVDKEDCDIDLSPESLEKDSIIKLLS